MTVTNLIEEYACVCAKIASLESRSVLTEDEREELTGLQVRAATLKAKIEGYERPSFDPYG